MQQSTGGDGDGGSNGQWQSVAGESDGHAQSWWSTPVMGMGTAIAMTIVTETEIGQKHSNSNTADINTTVAACQAPSIHLVMHCRKQHYNAMVVAMAKMFSLNMWQWQEQSLNSSGSGIATGLAVQLVMSQSASSNSGNKHVQASKQWQQSHGLMAAALQKVFPCCN